MDKILDVMEDVKQNITDNEYKIIMESLMKIRNERVKEKENEERVIRQYYTQKEFDEMSKVMVKLSIDIFFEYTSSFIILTIVISIHSNVLKSKSWSHFFEKRVKRSFF